MSAVFRKAAYATPVSRTLVAADFPAFSFGVFNDPPGQVWADFTHDTDEFVVVAEGDMEIEVAGETARCGPGDLVLIPARAPHTLRTSRNAGSMWFYGYGHFEGNDG
ncbi:cupin domain-containing protein [Roseibacterium sp. SDUM158017]|uniref:cupin domain-containing protein n=1 Tax=Roseicyclus salinarum TaxID=3036773 RepID=UPI0024152137|nr:cupin domain-containing protein [Roseibacterium sp. SDUM158017]MDG4647892.1 cupin domain-containing protein [Roseibacterium sp. SDUM158017]